MLSADGETVLAVWEAAADARGHRRALALVDSQPGAAGGAAGGDVADLPLGQRDALLLGLYRNVRGARLDALAECPSCATTLEVHVDIATLLHGYSPPAPSAGGYEEVDLGTAVVQARCPTTADLIVASGEQTAEQACASLLNRCVAAVRRPDGAARDLDDELDDDELDRLGRHMELLDPLVDVRLEIACDECGHGWSAFLDVPALAWAEVQAAARRLLREVDALALRYGWSQREILLMSERRRHAYLDLA